MKDILEQAKANAAVFDSFIKADSVINNPKYKTIICSISGGSDSDIMLDICYKVDKDKKIKYVWFDTGMEYQATKDHLVYLESKYNISIYREKAIKPIPLSVREYGQPFVSKLVSERIHQLQINGFKWQDKPYEELVKEYPNCKGALRWYCNKYTREQFKGTPSMFDIDRNKYLKQFLIENPPAFPIDSRCCKYAKKDASREIIKRHKADLITLGVRRGEGGIRSTSYKNCFTYNEGKADQYRPIFWYNDADKIEYEKIFGVTHSDCYTKYGLKRTGCAGCPYAKKCNDEIKVIKEYEPKLYKAATNIFKDSYEYTKQYREFVRKMNGELEQFNLFEEEQ